MREIKEIDLDELGIKLMENGYKVYSDIFHINYEKQIGSAKIKGTTSTIKHKDTEAIISLKIKDIIHKYRLFGIKDIISNDNTLFFENVLLIGLMNYISEKGKENE